MTKESNLISVSIDMYIPPENKIIPTWNNQHVDFRKFSTDGEMFVLIRPNIATVQTLYHS